MTSPDPDVVGMGGAAFEFVEDRPIRFGHDIGENVQAPAMRHADHDLADAQLAAALDDLLERRHHRLAAVQTKALGAGVFHIEEALEGLGLDELLQDRGLAPGGEPGLPAFDAFLNPSPLLGIGDVHVFDADRAAIGALQNVEDLAERREFETEDAADIDRAVVVGFGEAVGLRLELQMLAAGDEFERVEPGGEVAAGPIVADQHAGGKRVARRGKRLTLAERALRPRRQPRRLTRWRPGGPARFGDHAVPVVVETPEERTPVGIDRGGVLFVAGVKLGEVGGVGAV